MGKIQYKYLLFVAMIFNGLSLGALTMTDNYNYLCVARLVSGFSQIFVTIYAPVWVDCYSEESTKAFWLTMMLLSPPLGVVSGFGLTAVCIKYNSWKLSFRIQAIISFSIAVLMLLVHRSYVNIDECTALKK